MPPSDKQITCVMSWLTYNPHMHKTYTGLIRIFHKIFKQWRVQILYELPSDDRIIQNKFLFNQLDTFVRTCFKYRCNTVHS
jgi:hypothetical protein